MSLPESLLQAKRQCSIHPNESECLSYPNACRWNSTSSTCTPIPNGCTQKRKQECLDDPECIYYIGEGCKYPNTRRGRHVRRQRPLDTRYQNRLPLLAPSPPSSSSPVRSSPQRSKTYITPQFEEIIRTRLREMMEAKSTPTNIVSTPPNTSPSVESKKQDPSNLSRVGLDDQLRERIRVRVPPKPSVIPSSSRKRSRERVDWENLRRKQLRRIDSFSPNEEYQSFSPNEEYQSFSPNEESKSKLEGVRVIDVPEETLQQVRSQLRTIDRSLPPDSRFTQAAVWIQSMFGAEEKSPIYNEELIRVRERLKRPDLEPVVTRASQWFQSLFGPNVPISEAERQLRQTRRELKPTNRPRTNQHPPFPTWPDLMTQVNQQKQKLRTPRKIPRQHEYLAEWHSDILDVQESLRSVQWRMSWFEWLFGATWNQVFGNDSEAAREYRVQRKMLRRSNKRKYGLGTPYKNYFHYMIGYKQFQEEPPRSTQLPDPELTRQRARLRPPSGPGMWLRTRDYIDSFRDLRPADVKELEQVRANLRPLWPPSRDIEFLENQNFGEPDPLEEKKYEIDPFELDLERRRRNLAPVRSSPSRDISYPSSEWQQELMEQKELLKPSVTQRSPRVFESRQQAFIEQLQQQRLKLRPVIVEEEKQHVTLADQLKAQKKKLRRTHPSPSRSSRSSSSSPSPSYRSPLSYRPPWKDTEQEAFIQALQEQKLRLRPVPPQPLRTPSGRWDQEKIRQRRIHRRSSRRSKQRSKQRVQGRPKRRPKRRPRRSRRRPQS
jgi:hypothetical protein